jgi:DNA-directed RNA polymerase subunit RPC12/RpoP
MAKIRPDMDDAEFNKKCRQFLEQLIDAWQEPLEDEAKQEHLGSPSTYDASDVAEGVLEDLKEAAVLLGRGPWTGERDDEGYPIRFRNHYECAECGIEWTDDYTGEVDDDCPECGARHMSPVKTEDLDEDGNVVDGADAGKQEDQNEAVHMG